ncbi:MAG TPA: hypothetical protein VGM90_25410 [Kofleriaceae bacterium]|jgi:hypothetical protein
MSTYVVFVGATKETFEQSPVLAGEMLKKAGATPEADFVLEALTHKGGSVEHEYQSTDTVALDEHKEKFFRAVPKGGGRA